MGRGVLVRFMAARRGSVGRRPRFSLGLFIVPLMVLCRLCASGFIERWKSSTPTTVLRRLRLDGESAKKESVGGWGDDAR